MLVVAGASALAPKNPIAAENAQRGLVDWQPLEPNGAAHGIEGYSSQVSVSSGGLLQLHVSTRPAARYQVQIYRLGWYGGSGGRLMTCLPDCPKSVAGRPQALASPEPETGLLSARWPVSISFRIPRSWLSGY